MQTFFTAFFQNLYLSGMLIGIYHYDGINFLFLLVYFEIKSVQWCFFPRLIFTAIFLLYKMYNLQCRMVIHSSFKGIRIFVPVKCFFGSSLYVLTARFLAICGVTSRNVEFSIVINYSCPFSLLYKVTRYILPLTGH